MCRNSQPCRTCWVSVVTSSSQQKSQTWPHHLTSLTFWLFLPLTLSDPQGGGRVGVRRRRWRGASCRDACFAWTGGGATALSPPAPPLPACATTALLSRLHMGRSPPSSPTHISASSSPAGKNLPICQQKNTLVYF